MFETRAVDSYIPLERPDAKFGSGKKLSFHGNYEVPILKVNKLMDPLDFL
jgi:hypothetical protein